MKNHLLLKLGLLLICATLIGYIFYAHEAPNKTVNTALALQLPNTISTVSQEEHDISEKMMEKVRAADYEAAIQITLDGLKRFPQSFLLQSDLASLLGDFSEITPEPLHSKMVERAKTLFDKLLQAADTQPKNIFFTFKNEYYFRFKQYLNQYKLGVERVEYYWSTDTFMPEGVRGFYSQGVGAAHYAKQLMQQGDKAMAREYAEKSVVAWAQYFSYRNDYYNAYVHYALALGILGYKEEMMRALRRSAAIIKRDLDYHEFKEVIEFVETFDNKGH